MADTEKLAQALVDLDDVDWFTVLETAQSKRRVKYDNGILDQDPKPGATAAEFAAWMARCHLATDPGIREIIYLPANAPKNEIRLLELNVLLSVPEADSIQPVDFSPDIGGLDFRVVVADITPAQWQAIQAKQLPLPDGWDLTGYRRIGKSGPE